MELSKKQMEEIINASDKVSELYKELSNARKKLWEIEKGLVDGEWRNIKINYWKDICSKYPKEKLLNCYGDIFYIDEHDSSWYIGRRVLWNLGLSEEQYEIVETTEYDSDGEADYIDYLIKVV